MTVDKIFLDMDGVLADFDRGVNELCHMEAAPQDEKHEAGNDDLMWEAIRTADHFYDRLELMPGAKELFGLLWERYGARVEILTGIPREERGIVTAAEDKIAWTRRLLSDEVRIHTVCRKHKQLYCTGPETILIDDREKTVLEWRDHGGTGILYVNAEETMRILRQLGVLGS